MLFQDTILPLAASRTLSRCALMAVAMGLYSLLPVWKELSVYRDFVDMPSQFHAALSLVLGWLLVFRTNSAYARWWEARTLWGNLVNTCRNLAVKLTCLSKLTDSDRRFLEDCLTGFPVVLTRHLRSRPGDEAGSRSDASSNQWNHLPTQIVHSLYAWVGKQKLSNNIDGDELRVLDVEVQRLLEICGGCERIARTPVVRSYRAFARQCIALFLLSLPWGIAQDFGVWTLPLVMISSYFMIGMELVAEHVEEPFGLDDDDLDLEGLCQTIQHSVREIFSEYVQPA